MGGKRVLLRGHYNPTGTKRKYPNVQKIRLTDGRRLMVCTQCIKSIGNGKIKIASKPAAQKI